MEGKNCLRHTDLNSDRMKNLVKMVIERKDLVRKSLNREQLDSKFQSYTMVSDIARLEKYLWNYNRRTSCSSAALLQGMFQFLMTLSRVARIESLYLEDICDLCDFLLQNNKVKR